MPWELSSDYLAGTRGNDIGSRWRWRGTPPGGHRGRPANEQRPDERDPASEEDATDAKRGRRARGLPAHERAGAAQAGGELRSRTARVLRAAGVAADADRSPPPLPRGPGTSSA